MLKKTLIYSVYLIFLLFTVLLHADKFMNVFQLNLNIQSLKTLIIVVLICVFLEYVLRYVILLISYITSPCIIDGFSFNLYLYFIKLASCVKFEIQNKLFLKDVIVIENHDKLVGDIFLMNHYFNRIPEKNGYVDMSQVDSLNDCSREIYNDISKLNGNYKRSYILIDLKDYKNQLNSSITTNTMKILVFPVFLVVGIFEFIKKEKYKDSVWLYNYAYSLDQIIPLIFNWLLRILIIQSYFILAF